MKKALIASAALLSVVASAAAANAQTVGHVGLNYARTNVDAGALGDADLDTVQLEGAVRFDAGTLGAQVDGDVTRVDADNLGDDTNFAVTGHLNTKLGGGLVGGFVGVEHSDDVTFWGLGVEGQAALGASTNLYGQLGYGKSDDIDGADFWAARVDLRHYLSDNFKLQASLGALKVDTDLGDADVWTAGVEAEYQFTGTQWSVLAGYDHSDSDDLGGDADTWRIGARYTFGGSLKARDAAGADLGSVRRLFGAGLGF